MKTDNDDDNNGDNDIDNDNHYCYYSGDPL